jgi:hypothetical protein
MTDTREGVHILNFNSTKDYERIYFSDNDKDREDKEYYHTGLYDLKQKGFLTIGVHTNIENYQSDYLISLMDKKKLKSYTDFIGEKLGFNESCVVCLETNSNAIPLKCCGYNHHLCSNCIHEMYSIDDYSCPCCRQLMIMNIHLIILSHYRRIKGAIIMDALSHYKPNKEISKKHSILKYKNAIENCVNKTIDSMIVRKYKGIIYVNCKMELYNIICCFNVNYMYNSIRRYSDANRISSRQQTRFTYSYSKRLIQ